MDNFCVTITFLENLKDIGKKRFTRSYAQRKENLDLKLFQFSLILDS